MTQTSTDDARMHDALREFAWPGLARYRAGRREFEQARQLVRRHARPTVPPAAGDEPIPELEEKLYASPDDFAIGSALYRAQMAAGKMDAALATARHFTCAAGHAGLLSLPPGGSVSRENTLGTRLAILAG